MSSLRITKAHAYGNDFLFVATADLGSRDPVALARTLCDRHTGIGSDGLILYRFTPQGAEMRLINADGSRAEVSGNGVRCLGALKRRHQGAAGPDPLVIATEAGDKRLAFVERAGGRDTFRAAMGRPERIRDLSLDLAGERREAVALWMGNPQCVLRTASLDEAELGRLGPVVERHPAFPDRTNVEFVEVATPERLRILIWERGVGPTTSSGTGSCAAAVAAASRWGAARDVQVASPGGTQRVEWLEEGVYLTGWAEIVCEGFWIAER